MTRFFVFGSINIDYVFSLDHNPKMGETMHASSFQLFFGGKGANQALAISKLGGESYLIGDIGEDEQGNHIMDYLNQYGVNTEAVTIHQDSHTGLASIYVQGKNNQIVLASGANELSNHKDVAIIMDQYARKGDMLILQFEKKSDDIVFVAKFAKQKGLKVVCNPSPMNVDLLHDIKDYIDFLILNEIEYEMLTKSTYHGVNESLFDQLIITLGSEGSHAFIKGSRYIQNAIPTKVIDTTGAGDTFLGGFVAHLGRTGDYQESLKFAAHAAAIKVSRWGAQEGIPSLDEIAI